MTALKPPFLGIAATIQVRKVNDDGFAFPTLLPEEPTCEVHRAFVGLGVVADFALRNPKGFTVLCDGDADWTTGVAGSDHHALPPCRFE